jgi:hypothetical protein
VQHGETIEAALHVGRPARQIDAYTGRHRDHQAAPSSAAMTRARTAGSMLSSSLTTRPFDSAISMAPIRRRDVGASSAVATMVERLRSPQSVPERTSGVMAD